MTPPLPLLLILTAMPLVQADTPQTPTVLPLLERSSVSAEYMAGIDAIGRLREANLAYVTLAAGITNKAKAWMKRKALAAAYRQVDATCWELHRLRCPADIGEAQALTDALDACFRLPEELAARYRRFAQSGGYGQCFWLECPDPMFSRPIGNVSQFGDLARELDGLGPEARAAYDRDMAAAGLLQQLDAELRGLTRENLEARADTLTRLQAELAALPKETFTRSFNPRERRPCHETYPVFMVNTSLYSLLVQYRLLRDDAMPKDKRLEPLFRPLEALFRSEGSNLPPASDFKDACLGVPKENW